ncbi:hypothetical protein [Phormidesmis priestleyi]
MMTDDRSIHDLDSRWVQPQTSPDPDQVTFYTIANARYFIGLVALLNSLRLVGHSETLVVLDCGLTEDQQALLSPHCQLVEMPKQLASNPTLFKPFPYLVKPEGTVVIIDSDMIVTQLLTPILSRAAGGKICAFPDPEHDRWFPEWQSLFELTHELRRQVYVNAGFVVFSTVYWPDLLKSWWQACHKILSHPTIAEGVEDGPSAQADQDALNALLMSVIPIDALALQPIQEESYRDFQNVEVMDEKTLACRYQNHFTTILHCCSSPKSWETQALSEVGYNDAYVRLLRRLVVGQDVSLSLPSEQLPIWLHQGILGDLAFQSLDLFNQWVRPFFRVVKRSISFKSVARRI